MNHTYRLGIDVGSTTVKIACLNEENQVIFSDYERHFANIRETLLYQMVRLLVWLAQALTVTTSGRLV